MIVDNTTLTLLVVDADPAPRASIKSSAEHTRRSLRVLTADSVAAAAGVLASGPADLIVLDLTTAHDDTPDQRSALRRLVRSGPPFPALLLTGPATLEAEAYALGADIFLPAPYEPGDLREALRAGLQLAACAYALRGGTRPEGGGRSPSSRAHRQLPAATHPAVTTGRWDA